MTVRPILWKHKPRKDGTANIKIYVNPTPGSKYRKTPYYARPKDWDEDQGRIKKGVPLAAKINAQLERIVNEIIGDHLNGGSRSLIDLVKSHYDECVAGQHSIRFETYRSYPSFRNKLMAFAEHRGSSDINFEEVTIPFYHQFLAWLRGMGLGKHAVATNVKHLKKFMNLGFDLQLHKNEDFRRKAFASLKPKTNDQIYLTPDEMTAIQEVDVSDHIHLQREKDRFIISYYFLLRFKDSRNILQENFIERDGQMYYRNTSSKTSVTGFIPVKPLVGEILERIDYEIAPTYNQKANERIKIVAARAGIDEDINGNPKWSLVTTHTARRSAATNLWLAGTPLPEIMQLGGWRSEHQLKTYLVASGLELARISATRDFFK